MTNRLVFHVGYPKTGTTTLQTHVFPGLRTIRYLGKHIPNYEYSAPGLGEAITKISTASQATWIAPTDFEHLLGDGALTNLISTENFIHPASVCPIAIANRLLEVAPNAAILISLRSQFDLLESFYRNHGAFGAYLFLLKGEAEPLSLPLCFDEWLTLNFRAPHKNLLDLLHYDRVIAHYEKLFGTDRVHLIFLEELIHDREHYCSRLAAALDANASELSKLLSDHCENVALGRSAFDSMSAKLHNKATQLHGRGSSPNAREADDPAHPVIWNPTWRERVKEMYALGNTQLAVRHGLPLRVWGYPLNEIP